MSKLRSLGIGLSTAVLSAFILVAVPPQQAQAHCASEVSSRTIWAHHKNLGRQRARASWQFRARQKHGWAHRKWSKAANKYYDESYHVGSFYKWRIRAKGRPCH